MTRTIAQVSTMNLDARIALAVAHAPV